MTTSICDMDCLHCKFSDCVNDSNDLSEMERKHSTSLDHQVLVSRGIAYNPTTHKRQLKEVDERLYKQAQNRHFHKKYYDQDPDKFRQKGRESYRKHREARLKHSHIYHQEHREEISASKRTYYLEHREEILKSRKDNYTPHPREVIDTPEAEAKRLREKARYEANKEKINAKRRARRLAEKERKKNESNKDQQTGHI